MRAALRGVVVLAGTMALMASCTARPAVQAFRATYTKTACPEDIDFALVERHTCGSLTVLEDRSKPDGRTIKLFVVHVEPQNGTAASPDPIYVPGTKLAGVQKFFDVAPGADRTDRDEYIMDQRGVGRSESDLSCPEVDRLNAATVKVATDDGEARSTFIDAVGACAARLTAQGIDLGAYDIRAMAADGEDLRKALGIDQWGVISIGSASRVALEMVRDYPEHIREVVLDSPEVPQIDPFSEGSMGTRAALVQMAAACRALAACSTRFPDVEGAFIAARRQLDQHPLTLEGSSASGGQSVDVYFDGSMLLRSIRTLMAEEFDVVQGVTPAVVYSALDPKASALSSYLTAGAPDQQTYCLGYSVACDPTNTISVGAYLSVLCSDIAPFVDRRALADLASGDADYLAVFSRSPWLDACDAWKVPARIERGRSGVQRRPCADPARAVRSFRRAGGDPPSSYGTIAELDGDRSGSRA